MNPIGSSFEDFLKEEGIFEEVNSSALRYIMNKQCKSKNCEKITNLFLLYCDDCRLETSVKYVGDCWVSHEISKKQAWQLHKEKEPKDYDKTKLIVVNICSTRDCIKPDHLALMIKEDAKELRKEKTRKTIEKRNNDAVERKKNLEELTEKGWIFCHYNGCSRHFDATREYSCDRFCSIKCSVIFHTEKRFVYATYLWERKCDNESCWILDSFYQSIYYGRKNLDPKHAVLLLMADQLMITNEKEFDKDYGCIKNKNCLNPYHYEVLEVFDLILIDFNQEELKYFLNMYKKELFKMISDRLNNLVSANANQLMNIEDIRERIIHLRKYDFLYEDKESSQKPKPRKLNF